MYFIFHLIVQFVQIPRSGHKTYFHNKPYANMPNTDTYILYTLQLNHPTSRLHEEEDHSGFRNVKECK